MIGLLAAVASHRPAVMTLGNRRSEETSQVLLCAGKRKHKTTRFHDIAKNDTQNEYYAGGLDDEGRGSATTLIYPDEDKFNETKAEPPPPPPPKFSGSGRQL